MGRGRDAPASSLPNGGLKIRAYVLESLAVSAGVSAVPSLIAIILSIIFSGSLFSRTISITIFSIIRA